MNIIGHRGARELAPENTIASLRKAVAHGVDEIECDARVTRDGVVILSHDTEMRDQTGIRLSVKHSTYEELKHHKPDLTTLAEAIEAVAGQVPLQIEVKPRVATEPIIEVIKKYPRAHLLLGSKKQKILLELHRALPDIEKVVIEPWSGVRASRRARQLGTKRVSMNQLWLWRGFIRAFRRGGYQLYAYTLNDPAKANRWSKAGLTGVITDFPDRFEK